ncbi:hypothetical protein C8A01DRAFT_39658 [Parachaetomium inaequale]|uniref:Uncharacterized protein n=1 Tax=Parachaetomium inaequale TaxID=2588326 RepID=A0AAN6P8U3_9PEZI|nr:hypothetical protein C8A01DRAFT_39658 [Parachaetomium inaequale]
MDLGARIAAEKFYRDLREVFPDYAADFEQKFTEWQGKWFDPESPGSSSALERCELPEYDPLLFLGPKTIPLLVFELTKPGNFIATTLYNHLETDPQAKVDPEDIINYLTLNRHANLIVELNHERAQRVRRRLEAWKTRCRQLQQQQQPGQLQKQQSAELDTTACEEYDALVAMGSGIIAHVMLEYSKDRAGPWCQLMHQLVCEKPMGVMAHPGGLKQYEAWRDWFENREHHEAAEEGLMPAYLNNVGRWS